MLTLLLLSLHLHSLHLHLHSICGDTHPAVHPGLRAFAATNDGRLTIELIREFLAYFELSCTDNVLVSEAGQQNVGPINREALGGALAVVRTYIWVMGVVR